MKIVKEDRVIQLRKLSQQHAYTSIQMHEAVGRKAGLSGTDHKYLGFLLQKGPVTAGELALLTGLTTGAVTGLVDRFEKQQLVARQYPEGDRRKVMIVPEAQKIAALLQPLYRDFQDDTDRLFASFSAAELKTLEKYFSKALDIMQHKIEQLKRK